MFVFHSFPQVLLTTGLFPLALAETTLGASTATGTSRASLLSAARKHARRAAFEALAKWLGPARSGSVEAVLSMGRVYRMVNPISW